MNVVQRAMHAAQASMVQPRRIGSWSVKRQEWKTWVRFTSHDGANTSRVAPGEYTFLVNHDANCRPSPLDGEPVMNDTEPELRTHLQAMLTARGRVLVTGLGLGCVVRGMLAVGRVDEVVVLERESAVIELCGASVADPRVEIVHAEAESWLKANRGERFDTAWHDVWTDVKAGEPHLAVKHAHLMEACIGRVREQGAWAFPKNLRRLFYEATRRLA